VDLTLNIFVRGPQRSWTVLKLENINIWLRNRVRKTVMIARVAISQNKLIGYFAESIRVFWERYDFSRH